MASKHLFLLPRETMINILQRGKTEVEYSYHKKIALGDSITLREYTHGKDLSELMVLDGTVKSIEDSKSTKKHPNSKIYGINIQLILF
jgi:hypothetical protein